LKFQTVLKVQTMTQDLPSPTSFDAAVLLAADAIGDVIEHWGFRKALGRVWTVLYLDGEPQAAASLGERLQMSAGAVSMALGELQRWGVARRVWRPGERREFYEAETDFWKMISRVVQDREGSLVRSVHERLEAALALLRAQPQTAAARARMERVRRLLALTRTAEVMLETFLHSQRADFSEFGRVLQLGRAARREERR
jgi:DNA-binding transcriptional regulator GbsR (MarR family)